MANEEMDEDERFSKFRTDPKFRRASKKERKVAIDDRFKSMFKDKKFLSKTKVDKRGRPETFSAKENYKKYYRLENHEDGKYCTEWGEKLTTTHKTIFCAYR